MNARWGVVSYADSLDCVGVMAKEVSTVKAVFSTLTFVPLALLVLISRS